MEKIKVWYVQDHMRPMGTYLVTGGAGFIGSALVRKLLAAGNSIIVLDSLTYSGRIENLTEVAKLPNFEFIVGDFCDSELDHGLFEKYGPDAVINLAAETHVDRSIDSPDIFIQTNVNGVQTLLNTSLIYWRNLSGSKKESFRYLQVSTDEVYGSIKMGEVNEEAAFRPNSPYAASKASGDMLVRAYFQTYGLPTLVTHGSNTYGPRQFPEKFLPLIILRALSGLSLPVYGTGANQREWIHVEDHAEGVKAVLRAGLVGQSYNLGGEARLPNLEVAKTLCAKLDDRLPSDQLGRVQDLVEFVPDRPGHDFRYAMDSTKAKSELGWEPEINFQDGLASTIDWYINNAPWWQPITREKYSLTRLGTGEKSL